MKLRTARLSLLACIVLINVHTARAGTISLAWNPVTDSDLAGYRVYHDTVAGAYGNSVDVGLQTSATLQGLADCTTHEVAVKAYDAAGQYSATYSNVISGWPRPQVSAASPAQIQRNSQVQVTLDGINFKSGAIVKFSDAAITASNVSVSACNRLVVTASVGNAAALGGVTVRVVNTDGVYGEVAGLLSVTTDQTGPSITSVGAGTIGSTTATISWTTSEAADSKVYFRRQGETGYQLITNATQTTAHSIPLTGLWPSTVYQYHVTSTDAGGNESSSGADLTFTTAGSSFSYLRMDAEAGTLVAPVAVKSATDAFSGKLIELPAGATGTATSPAGESRISFHVPNSGSWRVWVRAFATDSGGVSWYEGVDSASLQSLTVPAANQWRWTPGRTYTLAAGLHTLRIAGRRGLARADRVIITNDASFAPTEQTAGDVTPPAAVTALVGTPGSNLVQLAWINPVETGALRIVARYRTDGVMPLGPADGLPLVDRTGSSGAADGFTHTPTVPGTTYSYALFALDFVGNVSASATVQVAPIGNPPPTVQNLRRTDVEP